MNDTWSIENWKASTSTVYAESKADDCKKRRDHHIYALQTDRSSQTIITFSRQQSCYHPAAPFSWTDRAPETAAPGHHSPTSPSTHCIEDKGAEKKCRSGSPAMRTYQGYPGQEHVTRAQRTETQRARKSSGVLQRRTSGAATRRDWRRAF